MSVNSWEFLAFFVLVFGLYYLPPMTRRAQAQNLCLLIASLLFYAFADWRALPLLILSVAIFYFLGLSVEQALAAEKERKATVLRISGIAYSVGMLLCFKYLDFITLPISAIGVSFFTFRLLGYLLDVSRERIRAEKDFTAFALYVSFFPTLLSGPIDRAGQFLPQLRESRKFDYTGAMDGCFQILWGMLLKMCIADNLAVFIDSVWAGTDRAGGLTLFVAAILYPVQLYADFDGYSHMAIGVAKILGIRVARNFDHPLLARNIAEYWRHWHMSLTSWLRDYVFMPLSMSLRRWGRGGICVSIVLTFFLIGIWHGSGGTYALFGLYHGLLFIPLVYGNGFRAKPRPVAGCFGLPRLDDFSRMVLTYLIVAVGQILFRAPSVADAVSFGVRMIDLRTWSLNALVGDLWLSGIRQYVFVWVLILLILEWFTRDKEYPFQESPSSGRPGRVVWRYALGIGLLTCLILFQGREASFIYYNF